jgi:glutathione S-transferase
MDATDAGAAVMSRLRIYGVARTRAFRALWMAHELGLDYEHLPIEIRDANPDAEVYCRLNPNGRLPTIDDDGFILWESLAINLYLAKKHALGTLYPQRLEDEAHTWKWCLWAANEVERAVNIWSLHAVRLPPAERNSAALNDALKVLGPPFRVLDAALAGRSYLVGDDFSVADLNVAAVISRALDMDLSATPHLAAWLKRCLDRPAGRKARALREAADAATPAEVTRMIVARNRL